VSTRRSMTSFAAPSVSRSSHQVSFAMSRKRVMSGFGSVAFNTRITACVLTGVHRLTAALALCESYRSQRGDTRRDGGRQR
jgi:hypothetical protein